MRWTTLAEARKIARENHRLARRGVDPTALRAGRHVPPTFAEGVEAVLALQRPNWRDGGKSEKQWRASLDTYAVALMSKPVSDITAHDVLAVVGPVWNDKRERRRGGGCFNASARCSGGPWPMDIGPTLRSRPCGRRSRRMAFTGRALAHGEVGAALATIRESQAWPSTRLALEFVALTAGAPDGRKSISRPLPGPFRPIA